MSQQINLFNPLFRKKETLLSAKRVALALFVLILAEGAFSGYRHYQTASLAKQDLALTAELSAAQQTFAQLDSRRSAGRSKLLEAEIARIESKTQEDQKILSLLKGGDLGDTKGYSSYMAGFARQIMTGVWLTGFEIVGAGSHMTLQGRALQADRVPAYLARLNQEPVLRGKAFASLELNPPKNKTAGQDKSAENEAYVEFRISSEELPDKADETGLPQPSSEDRLTGIGKSLNEQNDKYNQQLAPIKEIAAQIKEKIKAP